MEKAAAQPQSKRLLVATGGCPGAILLLSSCCCYRKYYLNTWQGKMFPGAMLLLLLPGAAANGHRLVPTGKGKVGVLMQCTSYTDS